MSSSHIQSIEIRFAMIYIIIKYNYPISLNEQFLCICIFVNFIFAIDLMKRIEFNSE